ncbi:AAA family ATPase [Bacteroidota bacterium]
MENILMKYMGQRFQQTEKAKVVTEPGPVVTISRLTGCPAKRIARKLSLKLNDELERFAGNVKWRCVSKEILSEAAKELNLPDKQIDYVFNFEERSTWDDIMSSLSTKYYKSDRKIRKTIADIIRAIAVQGNAIIIGRGSVVIVHDIPKSLHINFEAPLVWRAEMLSQRKGVSVTEAKKIAIETDLKRERFRNSFYGKNTDYTTFDVTYNCMTLTDVEIVESIYKLMILKKLITVK